MRSNTHVLEKEVRTYRKHHARLLRQHEGEWVLIHGSRVVGLFPDRDSALEAGIERLGDIDFFVRQIKALEPVRRAVSLRVDGRCR